MSDKLKRVLDTNLAGLHVTDAQVNAVLRRVSQDEKRPRVIRWQAIAAVLLVLVLGAGVLLQTGILSDDSPQLTADVTRQGDFLTAAQVKKLLASAADLQFSVDEEAISALMTQVEKDGGCSLSTLLEILCPAGSSLGQWDIRAGSAQPDAGENRLSGDSAGHDARTALHRNHRAGRPCPRSCLHPHQ